MNIPRSRYYFRFLLLVQWDGVELKFNKVAPILNQLGIEDSNALEDMIRFYLENLEWRALEPLKIRPVLQFIIWRRQAFFSLFNFKVFSFEDLYKYWLDVASRNYVAGAKMVKMSGDTFAARFGFNMAFLATLIWSSEYGYRKRFLNWTSALASIKGTQPLYAHRHEMLGRKVNFRRRVKKKKFEEY